MIWVARIPHEQSQRRRCMWNTAKHVAAVSSIVQSRQPSVVQGNIESSCLSVENAVLPSRSQPERHYAFQKTHRDRFKVRYLCWPSKRPRRVIRRLCSFLTELDHAAVPASRQCRSPVPSSIFLVRITTASALKGFAALIACCLRLAYASRQLMQFRGKRVARSIA